MLAIFCLRLTWGMIAALLILPAEQVHPRFFRVQFLTVLGLLLPAGIILEGEETEYLWIAAAMVTGLLCCVAGSIVWHVEGSPGAKAINVATAAVLTCLLLMPPMARYSPRTGQLGMIADNLTSAALLGSTISAMLMGHSYLVAPAMSLTPLMRLLAAIGVSLILRFSLGAYGMLQWLQTSDQAAILLGGDPETMLLLAVRWGLGYIGVLALTWMAWESARICSTQSATGILYVVVIFCFLGELTSQFLTMKTGFIL